MGDASPTAESVDPLIGRVINDRFEILELIARGGMGRVYKAQQRPLGREVAVKVLDPRHQGEMDPEFQARFFLEASTSAKLSHPNTVTVFDYGKTTDEIYFIVMEFVEGRTLAAMLKDVGPIEPNRAINIAIQIARSLREAHSLGVIHRDLKPANVLLTRHADEEDFVKVLDFGLVKNVAEDDELTQAGLFMGSPKYMAPEQIQGGDVDGRTDVYALGVMLYLMLTGRVPFDRSNQVQILMAHMREAVPPLTREDGVAIPAGITQVVMRCLAKEADARFANMNEVITALKHAGSHAGMNIQTSGAFNLEGMDLSGMRSVAGTPGGGMPMVTGTPSGGLSSTGDHSQPSIPEIDIDASFGEPKKKGIVMAVIALLILAIGGGAAFAMMGGEEGATDPEAEIADATGEEGEGSGAESSAEEEGAEAASARGEAAEGSDEAAGSEGTPTEEARAGAAQGAEPGIGEMARVVVNLRSDPSGAEVFVGDRAYGSTPASVEWVGEQAEQGREVTFRFMLSGYRPTSLTRTISGDTLDVEADLSPVVRRRARPRPSPMEASPMVSAPALRNANFRDNPY